MHAAATLIHWWQTTPTTELIWIFIGLTAQLLFSMRFIVQWIATERARASIIPETFWYFSFFGGLLLLAYACYRADPVFHYRSSRRPRHLLAQHLFHLARQASTESRQSGVAHGSACSNLCRSEME